MAQIIRSGAFLQQCWSVHPLCVAVKRMTDARSLVLSCSSCKSTHHLVLGTVASSASHSAEGRVAQEEVSAEELLQACASTHQEAVTLRNMDVFQDLVLLRCADCRRQYELSVTAFETHHK